ncbi:Gfo/Idh/MocA family protein, partial [Cetobacterium sp.]|uniref:Gfo/Idh/MocA family protein n=1 Tax=Cetobacterium sp. TaxID=2071632 RepID=UPI003F2AF982
MQKKDLNWGILGTGVVANEMAVALKKAGKKIYSVGNRTHSKALEFAQKYEIDKVYDNFNELFVDENVDVIYITTPHNTHIDFILKAIENGKHILCEKAITLNSEELDSAIVLAKEKNVVLAEAMTIFHMPIYKDLKDRIDSGKLGELRMIQLNFGSY